MHTGVHTGCTPIAGKIRRCAGKGGGFEWNVPSLFQSAFVCVRHCEQFKSDWAHRLHTCTPVFIWTKKKRCAGVQSVCPIRFEVFTVTHVCATKSNQLWNGLGTVPLHTSFFRSKTKPVCTPMLSCTLFCVNSCDLFRLGIFFRIGEQYYQNVASLFFKVS